MHVYLVHHAEAVGPDVDAMRPLSAAGRSQATWLSAEAARLGVKPAFIWHSGKLRARQTAEAFLVACNPFATLRMMRGLSPGDPAGIIADAIEGEDLDVMLVGHQPHLPALLEMLTGTALGVPAHGLVALERTDERRYVETRRIVQPAGRPQGG